MESKKILQAMKTGLFFNVAHGFIEIAYYRISISLRDVSIENPSYLIDGMEGDID